MIFSFIFPKQKFHTGKKNVTKQQFNVTVHLQTPHIGFFGHKFPDILHKHQLTALKCVIQYNLQVLKERRSEPVCFPRLFSCHTDGSLL